MGTNKNLNEISTSIFFAKILQRILFVNKKIKLYHQFNFDEKNMIKIVSYIF